MRAKVLELIPHSAPRNRPAPPEKRGYLISYRVRETNHCPGCGASQWIIGRQSAECAVCSTAIPFSASDYAALCGAVAGGLRS